MQKKIKYPPVTFELRVVEFDTEWLFNRFGIAEIHWQRGNKYFTARVLSDPLGIVWDKLGGGKQEVALFAKALTKPTLKESQIRAGKCRMPIPPAFL